MWSICLLFCLASSLPSGHYTVDRVEGDLAVLVWRTDERIALHVPAEDLFSPGDIWQLEFADQGIMAHPLPEETELARARVKQLLERLTDSSFLDAPTDL
ncbi:MAG: DUF3006 domain-containing protein [Limnochordia bacterium]|nr:DUF3006 domain-containing protein [Bacillota bacterium]